MFLWKLRWWKHGRHTGPRGSQMLLISCNSVNLCTFLPSFFNHKRRGKWNNLKAYRDHVKNQAKRLEFGLRVIGLITENNPLTPSYESAEQGIRFKIEHSEKQWTFQKWPYLWGALWRKGHHNMSSCNLGFNSFLKWTRCGWFRSHPSLGLGVGEEEQWKQRPKNSSIRDKSMWAALGRPFLLLPLESN